jgi:hypothetical protein
VTFDSCWRTPDVVGLAQAIYDDKSFERMPINRRLPCWTPDVDEQGIGHCEPKDSMSVAVGLWSQSWEKV